MFNRNIDRDNEITSAPTSAPADGSTTYPPDIKNKNHGVTSSAAEMGLSGPGLGEDDTDSGFGSNPKAHDRDTGVVVDAVWGRIDENGPNYRNLGW